MKIPLKYSIRNFMTRKLTTGITVVGIMLVVFVFSAVLMMAYGIQKTLIATGTMKVKLPVSIQVRISIY